MPSSPSAPLVSVCIPCFNAQEFVAEAIESALGQTHPRVEVVVVDDGSSDASVAILEKFGDKIVFEASPNRGACAARNRALALSKGQYIQFLDADDRLVPRKIERQLPYLLRGEADLVFCRGFIFGDGKPMRPKKKSIVDPQGIDPFVYCLKQGLSTEGPLHRREWVERVNGFNESLKRAQELDFHLRLAACDARILLLDDLLYQHRDHSGPRITRGSQPVDQMLLLLLDLSENLETSPYRFTPERRAALAGAIFQHSIYAFRGGAPQTARRGFARARSLAELFDYEERRTYKMLVSAIGPMAVEHSLSVGRRAKAMLGSKSKPRIQQITEEQA
ncbi:MAG TPA: glycosyltransferase [Abditibacterium sp.]|jgi:glycosyltransferase involved in cell wall biosynthesis